MEQEFAVYIKGRGMSNNTIDSYVTALRSFTHGASLHTVFLTRQR